MPFQVISPMLMNVDGSDFNEAVKNFIKLNRHLNINELILTDQINNMRANIRYYNRGGRHKAGIRLQPTTSRVISTFPGSSVGIVSPLTVGVSSNDPFAPFPLVPGFARPSAVIGPNGEIRDINPVVPVTLDGKPLSSIQPVLGVTRSNIMGVGASGPILRPGIVAPMIPPTPIAFAPASSVTTVEWVDSTGKKFEDSNIVEKEYAKLKDKNITVEIKSPNWSNGKCEFSGNKCKLSYTPTGTTNLSQIELTRKGPASPNYKVMVAASPTVIGPIPRMY